MRTIYEWIYDDLIPTAKGRRDKHYCLTYEDKFNQATTCRDLFVANYDREVQSSIRRNLTALKKRLSELEVQHICFLQWQKQSVEEISKRPGLSEQARALMIEDLINATILTREISGKVTIIDLDEILEEKKIICSEANARKRLQLDRLLTLKSRYERKWRTYLRTLNKENNCKLVNIPLGIEDADTDMWNFLDPLSSHMNSKKHEMEEFYHGTKQSDNDNHNTRK